MLRVPASGALPGQAPAVHVRRGGRAERYNAGKGCRSPRRFPAPARACLGRWPRRPPERYRSSCYASPSGPARSAASTSCSRPITLPQTPGPRSRRGRCSCGASGRRTRIRSQRSSNRSSPDVLGGYYGRRLAAHRDAVAGLGRTSSRSATFTPRRSQRDVAAAGRRRPPSARRPPRAWPRIVNTCGLARASARIVCSSCLQTCVSCRPFAQYGQSGSRTATA